MFQKVDAYAGDPILTLMERFKEDPRSDKVNLSIGLYYNEDGIIPQLKAVADAEARLNAVPHGASLYLPMEGLNSYRHAIESGRGFPETLLPGIRRLGQRSYLGKPRSNIRRGWFRSEYLPLV